MENISLRKRVALELHRKMVHRLRASHPLRQLFWESTHRCNLACRHCGSDCKSHALTPDMPAEDFLRVVDSIKPHVDSKRVLVIITGGEPLMRDDLEDVGLELYRREFPWGIVTNGLALTAERFGRLLDSGMRSITISLDGTAENHNWMRCRRDSFDKAYAAIKMAAAATEVNFDVVTCVNRRSLAELDAIKSLLIDAGVKSWRLFTIFPSGRAAGYPEFELDSAELTRLMDFIRSTRAEGKIKASFCCEGFMGGYEGEVRDSFYTCWAGVHVASVLIDGSIAACPSIRADYSQGNIYRDDFWDVWQNCYEKYRNRDWMRTGICHDCDMFRYCEGNGMHLREADGSLKHCNYRKLVD